MKGFKIIAFSVKMMKIIDGNIIEKIKRTNKYTKLFIYHSQQQKKIKEDNLNKFLNEKTSKIQKNTDYYKQTIQKYFEWKKKVISHGKQQLSDLKDENIRESLIKNMMKSGLEKLTLFYQSLQSLVEGRRQVLNNEQFRFQDGSSVKDKREEFERLLQRFFGKKTKGKTPSNHNQQNL